MFGRNRNSNSGKASLRWLKLGLLNVVFLIAPFSVWFYLHVDDRLEASTNSLFRVLAELDASLVSNLSIVDRLYDFSPWSDPAETESSSDAELLAKTKLEAELTNLQEQFKWLADITASEGAYYLNQLEYSGDKSTPDCLLEFKQDVSAISNILAPTAPVTTDPPTNKIDTLTTHVKKLEGVNCKSELTNGETSGKNFFEQQTGRGNRLLSIHHDYTDFARASLDMLQSYQLRQEELTKQTKNDNARNRYMSVLKANPVFKNVEISALKHNCATRSTYLATKEGSDNNSATVRVLCTPDSEAEPHAIVDVPMSDIFTNTTRRNHSIFDQILLVNNNGDVFARTSPAIAHDEKLIGPVTIDPFRNDFSRYGNIEKILIDAIQPTHRQTGSDKEPNRLLGLPSHSMTHEIEIGDTAFTLFIQPSAIAISPKNAPNQWFLVGVVTTSKLVGDAVVAPITITGPLMLLIIIAMSVIPLLWIGTSTKRTWMTSSSSGGVFASGVVVTGLACISMLHIYFDREANFQKKP